MVVDYKLKLQFDLTTYKNNGQGFPLGLGGYFEKAKQKSCWSHGAERPVTPLPREGDEQLWPH